MGAGQQKPTVGKRLFYQQMLKDKSKVPPSKMRSFQLMFDKHLETVPIMAI